MATLYQWCTLDGSNSMPSFAELTAQGFTVCGTSARFNSLLMRKDDINESTAGGGGHAWVGNHGVGSNGSELGNSNAPSGNCGASDER